jgi:hypothetical protein
VTKSPERGLVRLRPTLGAFLSVDRRVSQRSSRCVFLDVTSKSPSQTNEPAGQPPTRAPTLACRSAVLRRPMELLASAALGISGSDCDLSSSEGGDESA